VTYIPFSYSSTLATKLRKDSHFPKHFPRFLGLIHLIATLQQKAAILTDGGFDKPYVMVRFAAEHHNKTKIKKN